MMWPRVPMPRTPRTRAASPSDLPVGTDATNVRTISDKVPRPSAMERWAMRRTCLLGLLVVAGCALPPERVPLQRLPEDGPPLPYAELLTRARAQATYATEAFYVNKWNDLEDAARGLEQSARFLGRAQDVPDNRKAVLPRASTELAAESRKLIEAAKAHDEKATEAGLQTVHRLVRQLRLAD